MFVVSCVVCCGVYFLYLLFCRVRVFLMRLCVVLLCSFLCVVVCCVVVVLCCVCCVLF